MDFLPRLRRSHRLALLTIGACALSYLNTSDFYDQRRLSSIFEGPTRNLGSPSGNEGRQENENENKCPDIISKMKGIYKNPSDDPSKKFENVILVTAASSGFEDYLRNWEMHADDFNLKWLTVAFDKDLYNSRDGAERNLLISNDNQEKEKQDFGAKGYYKLVCNKMRIVLEILESCNIDVMFSDTDIALMQDPFKHELGNKIASGQFDYIFQHNMNKGGSVPGEHPCMKGSMPGEGNTGFHYMKPTTEVKNLIKKTLTMCEAEDIDDQTAFWKVMSNSTDEWTYCSTHTSSTTNYAPRKEGKNQYCCLDPYYYTVAFEKPEPAHIDDIVMFHSNWAAGNNKKWKLKTWLKDGWRLPLNYN